MDTFPKVAAKNFGDVKAGSWLLLSAKKAQNAVWFKAVCEVDKQKIGFTLRVCSSPAEGPIYLDEVPFNPAVLDLGTSFFVELDLEKDVEFDADPAPPPNRADEIPIFLIEEKSYFQTYGPGESTALGKPHTPVLVDTDTGKILVLDDFPAGPRIAIRRWKLRQIVPVDLVDAFKKDPIVECTPARKDRGPQPTRAERGPSPHDW